MLITIIILCISALATWTCLYLLVVKIRELKESITTLTNIHNWNMAVLTHNSEHLQEVEVVKP